jgi:hypothetical protein
MSEPALSAAMMFREMSQLYSFTRLAIRAANDKRVSMQCASVRTFRWLVKRFSTSINFRQRMNTKGAPRLPNERCSSRARPSRLVVRRKVESPAAELRR